MRCKTYIDLNNEEEVIIYAKKRTILIDAIENLVETNNTEINGTLGNETTKINPLSVSCFISENNKVFALIDGDKYQIKQKLYQVEELLDTSFVRINQSCVANMKKIRKFKSSIGGSVLVIFDNDYQDYISRRELKNVKERMGL